MMIPPTIAAPCYKIAILRNICLMKLFVKPNRSQQCNVPGRFHPKIIWTMLEKTGSKPLT